MTPRAAIRHPNELHGEGVGRHDGRPFGPTQSGNRTYDLGAAFESVSPAIAMIDRGRTQVWESISVGSFYDPKN
jgi:hypothetical protein